MRHVNYTLVVSYLEVVPVLDADLAVWISLALLDVSIQLSPQGIFSLLQSHKGYSPWLCNGRMIEFLSLVLAERREGSLLIKL